MLMRLINKILRATLLILFLSSLSCTNENFEGIHGEGKVEYDITYIKNHLEGFSAYMLPKKMTLEFSPRYTVNTIENMLGLISIKNISDLKFDTVTTAFKYSNHKYFYTSKPKEYPCCFEILERPEVELLNDSTIIAGVYCKKAKVSFPSLNESHYVYYTDVINASIINKNTAYEDIPGILMDFQMEMGNLKMKFTASKLEFKDIENTEFKIPNGFERITRNEMVKIIHDLLE